MRKSRFRSRLAMADQMSEAWASLRAHPIRSVVMSLGVVLGVATVVTTTSLADTTRFEVESTFDALRPTRVDVDIAEPSADGFGPDGELETRRFPPGAPDRVAALEGVIGASLYADWRSGLTRITASNLVNPPLLHEARVVGVDHTTMPTAEAVWRGGSIQSWHVDRSARVAIIGRTLADQLGISADESHRYLYVDGVPFLVMGIVDDGGRLPQMEASVVIPITSLIAHWAVEAERMLIHVRSGAAPGIAEAAPVAIDPTDPQRYKASEPADPRVLRTVVESDLAALGLWLALVATLAGLIGITSSTYGAIYERMNEFGLRRALGARSGHLRRHVLTECGVVGLLAGVGGSVTGLVAVLTFSTIRGWSPVVDPRLLLAAPLLGLASGLLAGIIPAWKAGRLEPAEALRR